MINKISATTALAVAAAVAAAASSALARTASVPHSLVATWGKSISLATWKKNHITDESPGHYAIVIAKGGLTNMYHGNDPTMASVSIPFTNMHATVAGHTITFSATADGACPSSGSYHWALSGRKLNLTLLKDTCAPRKVLMTAGPFTLEH